LLLKPGESIVVVHDLAAFTSLYGTNVRLAGEFSGSLANSGERLTLLGPLGEPILDFSYDPAWYPITDGGGFSLVVVDPSAPASTWGLAANWRPSSELGGSPAALDPAPPPASLSLLPIAGSNAVVLTWPAAAGSFTLYATGALAPPGQWFRVANAPVLSNGRWMVAISPAGQGTCFYRLQAP